MSLNYSMNQNFDEDDDENLQQSFSGRDGTIFIIDCATSMFTTSDGEDISTFEICLTVLERLLLNKIISSSKDLFGVILYNTAKSPDPDGPGMTEDPLPVSKNCAILIPMQQVEADSIRYVKNMKKSRDFLDFDNKFGHSNDAKIADVLWLCSTMFSNCGKKIRVPQIMWYTSEDQPHNPGTNEHLQAFQKAKDLQQFQLDFQFFPMKEDFNGDLFYKELIAQLLDVDIEDFEFPTPEFDEKVLLRRMFRQGYGKRALGYINVELSENAKFGVGIYSFARKAVAPKVTKFARDTNEEIVAKRSYKYAKLEEGDLNLTEVEFKDTLESAVSVKYQECGGEKIMFTPMEAFEIKQMMDPKIKVLGFKPSSVLVDHNHIHQPYFLYPSETTIKNSAVFFRTLWERCLSEDKVVICAFTMRLRSMPRLVALVPQEQSETDGEVYRFDGFRMIFIPFAGDLRDVSDVMKAPEEIDDHVAEAMKKIVSRLRIRYSATMFENPFVKKLYAKIEEQLFAEPGDEVDQELSKDLTLPETTGQDVRIDEFVETLEQLVGGFESIAIKSTKRKGSEEPGEPKKAKITADDVNVGLVLKKCLANDTKSLTVGVLRAYLQLKKFAGSSKMNKAQMIEKVVELK